ncbi:MAG: D-sedoheptulose-7-phosphate isomerase [Sciscionella sp.]
MEMLYPFLYSTSSDVDAVMAKVRQSTVDKAREIIELRRRVAELNGSKLLECVTAMAARFSRGGRLFAFGNGGSSTDAQDMAAQFMAPPVGVRPLPAFALTGDVAVVTALSNDIGFDVVFARQLAAFGKRNDIALGLSTSGNSANLLAAFDEASRRGMLTIGIAGETGGKMGELDTIDYLFVVPSPSVHRIQEAQTTIYHALCELTALSLTDGYQSNRPESTTRASG